MNINFYDKKNSIKLNSLIPDRVFMPNGNESRERFGEYPFCRARKYDDFSEWWKSVVPSEKKEFNSLNFRSSEFLKNHNGLKHIVFTGCSMTYGLGLKQEEIWSKLLFNKIKEKEELSGYFNLASPGTSIIDQIINLFKYFKVYGNPNIIFFNMPDLLRFYMFDSENKNIVDAVYKEDSKPVLSYLCSSMYLMLEQYCNSNNIVLMSFSWSENFNNFQNFKSFYNLNLDEMYNFVYDYKDNDFSEIARDGKHLGTAYNIYWANIMYNIYESLNNDNLRN